MKLVREYAAQQSERAFAALVSHHIIWFIRRRWGRQADFLFSQSFQQLVRKYSRQLLSGFARARTKEEEVPKTEIERAIKRKKLFEANPKAHTYESKS